MELNRAFFNSNPASYTASMLTQRSKYLKNTEEPPVWVYINNHPCLYFQSSQPDARILIYWHGMGEDLGNMTYFEAMYLR